MCFLPEITNFGVEKHDFWLFLMIFAKISRFLSKNGVLGVQTVDFRVSGRSGGPRGVQRGSRGGSRGVKMMKMWVRGAKMMKIGVRGPKIDDLGSKMMILEEKVMILAKKS